MKHPILTLPALLATLTVGANAAAYENENAVPLTLGLEAGQALVEQIAVKLDGREVSVLTTLRNDEARARPIGWYASTPQFGVLGDGEEHLDKCFPMSAPVDNANLGLSVLVVSSLAGTAGDAPPKRHQEYR